MMALRFSAHAMLTALLAIIAPATWAQDDPRLVTHAYDATRIVRIQGRLGVQATVVFGEDEKIENVAVGDSQKWQITPNKRANLLFAKPLDAAATTNMTVVTDKRTYLFDLVASIKERPVYMLRFTYGQGVPVAPTVAVSSPPALAAPAPDLPIEASKSVPVAATVAAAAPVVTVGSADGPMPVVAEKPLAEPLPSQPTLAVTTKTAVDEAIAASVDSVPSLPSGPVRSVTASDSSSDHVAASEPGALNFAWLSAGARTIQPRRIYDDGSATYLLWGAKQTVPAVSYLDPDGQEVSSSIITEGKSVVIPSVPVRILLRSGNASATFENLRRARLTLRPDGSN